MVSWLHINLFETKEMIIIRPGSRVAFQSLVLNNITYFILFYFILVTY